VVEVPEVEVVLDQLRFGLVEELRAGDGGENEELRAIDLQGDGGATS